jgi:hypothetical protein
VYKRLASMARRLYTLNSVGDIAAHAAHIGAHPCKRGKCGRRPHLPRLGMLKSLDIIF